jgi:hypothetical protein
MTGDAIPGKDRPRGSNRDGRRRLGRTCFRSGDNFESKSNPLNAPTQSVTTPRLRPSRRIKWMRRVVRIAPVAPIGWPSAIAPPSILTMSPGSPSLRMTAMTIAAKASLISIRLGA